MNSTDGEPHHRTQSCCCSVYRPLTFSMWKAIQLMLVVLSIHTSAAVRLGSVQAMSLSPSDQNMMNQNVLHRQLAGLSDEELTKICTESGTVLADGIFDAGRTYTSMFSPCEVTYFRVSDRLGQDSGSSNGSKSSDVTYTCDPEDYSPITTANAAGSSSSSSTTSSSSSSTTTTTTSNGGSSSFREEVYLVSWPDACVGNDVRCYPVSLFDAALTQVMGMTRQIHPPESATHATLTCIYNHQLEDFVAVHEPEYNPFDPQATTVLDELEQEYIESSNVTQDDMDGSNNIDNNNSNNNTVTGAAAENHGSRSSSSSSRLPLGGTLAIVGVALFGLCIVIRRTRRRRPRYLVEVGALPEIMSSISPSSVRDSLRHDYPLEMLFDENVPMGQRLSMLDLSISSEDDFNADQPPDLLDNTSFTSTTSTSPIRNVISSNIDNNSNINYQPDPFLSTIRIEL
jgi:hypothetical protein